MIEGDVLRGIRLPRDISWANTEAVSVSARLRRIRD